VTITIYNVQGQLVRTLNLGRREAGFYVSKENAAYWNGRNDSGEQIASGIYFYQIKAGTFDATKRLVILK
jgi:flagellar hook assembly protein FlgD